MNEYMYLIYRCRSLQLKNNLLPKLQDFFEIETELVGTDAALTLSVRSFRVIASTHKTFE